MEQEKILMGQRKIIPFGRRSTDVPWVGLRMFLGM
jgi:hypothetical protein